MGGLASTSTTHSKTKARDSISYVVANHNLTSGRSQPRMTWDGAISRPLECCAILLMCPMSHNEQWITMGGISSSSTTHSKTKATDGSLYWIEKHPLIARHSMPRMTWDDYTSRPLECCTTLLICLMSHNEMWISMGGLASILTTHFKTKARGGSLYLIAKHPLIARRSQPRMTWNADPSRPLE